MTTAKQMLTEEELAKRWQISTRTLQYWRRDGKGCPFIDIGRNTIRYRLEDVIAYEESRIKNQGSSK